jgi:hypothetical protein
VRVGEAVTDGKKPSLWPNTRIQAVCAWIGNSALIASTGEQSLTWELFSRLLEHLSAGCSGRCRWVVSKFEIALCHPQSTKADGTPVTRSGQFDFHQTSGAITNDMATLMWEDGFHARHDGTLLGPGTRSAVIQVVTSMARPIL